MTQSGGDWLEKGLVLAWGHLTRGYPNGRQHGRGDPALHHLVPLT